ncbi:MAG TPA: hypothetical protein VF230_03450 [Acidimicrobiales bacterium]
MLRWTARAFGILVGVVLFVLGATWLWWIPGANDATRSSGPNATWAKHAWVGEAQTGAAYDRLAKLIADNRLTDVFFHVGPLDADGSIPPERYEHATTLLAALADRSPDVRAQAWVGQVTERGGGPLHHEDDGARTEIVRTAEALLDVGFEGIHYDLEPIYPGDDAFLDLLDRTRAVTEPRDAVLSVAMEQMELVGGSQRVVSKVVRRYHDPTRVYLREVAERVDQLAIMTYDTGMPTDWTFGAFTAWQTEHVVEAVPADTTVFMGVPSYSDGHFFGFHPWAENVRAGVRGVRKGIARVPSARRGSVGVAIYAEWTTQPKEWADYRRGWLPRPDPSDDREE